MTTNDPDGFLSDCIKMFVSLPKLSHSDSTRDDRSYFQCVGNDATTRTTTTGLTMRECTEALVKRASHDKSRAPDGCAANNRQGSVIRSPSKLHRDGFCLHHNHLRCINHKSTTISSSLPRLVLPVTHCNQATRLP